MKIYLNVQELLKQNNMTSVQLSKATWISQEHISLMKNGKTTQVQFQTIEKLLWAFNCNISDLIKVQYE